MSPRGKLRGQAVPEACFPSCPIYSPRNGQYHQAEQFELAWNQRLLAFIHLYLAKPVTIVNDISQIAAFRKMPILRQYVAPLIVLLIFVFSLVVVSARIFLPQDLAAPGPGSELLPPTEQVQTTESETRG
ncbi:MAG: hypothetical protein ACFBSC_17460 [Microcoleaceae cyanobacterium]